MKKILRKLIHNFSTTHYMTPTGIIPMQMSYNIKN